MGTTPLGATILLLLLMAPLCAGVVLLILSLRQGRGYPACGQCGYNVTGHIGSATRCPECGSEFAAVGITPAKGRANRLGLWIGIALMFVPLTCVGMGVLTVLAERRALEAQQAAAAAQAAAARAQALAAPTQPQPFTTDPGAVPSQPLTEAPLPAPLTQERIDAMSIAELQQALAEISRARQYSTQEPDVQARLRAEFMAVMDRMRELRAAESEPPQPQP